MFLFRLAGREGIERGATEEGDLDVPGEAVKAEEPALTFDAIEGRVPFNGLAQIWNGGCDERVEAAADVAFPAGHGGDVGVDRCITIGLRNLRFAAGEKLGLVGGVLLGHGAGRVCSLASRPIKPKTVPGSSMWEDPGSALLGSPGRAMFAAAEAKSGPQFHRCVSMSGGPAPVPESLDCSKRFEDVTAGK